MVALFFIGVVLCFMGKAFYDDDENDDEVPEKAIRLVPKQGRTE